MASILPTTFWNAFSWIELFKFRFSIEFVPKGLIDNIPAVQKKKKIPAVVQIMAWGRKGDKPLSEPMIS